MAATAYIVLAICALANGALLRRPILDGRIVGGEDANIEDLPYQLSLMRRGYHICGASIISDEWALTAAHCTEGKSASSMSVRAGSSRWGSGGSVHQVAEIIQHKQFDSHTADYDFALLRVSTKFNLGQAGVQAVDLADSEPAAGDKSVISGWGDLSLGRSSPWQLQVVTIPIVNRLKCADIYTEFVGITARMICAGVDAGGKGACLGDNGGPLVVDGKLAGVASWGAGCDVPKYPGVYSNVANQRAWIKENTGI